MARATFPTVARFALEPRGALGVAVEVGPSRLRRTLHERAFAAPAPSPGVLDDLVEADKLVGSIGELLAQRNALREQVQAGTEIVTQRQAVEQEVAALDADLATRQRVFADEIARMEQQTATTRRPNKRARSTSCRTFA